MVGKWVFTVKMLKLCFMFENFSNQMLEKLLLRWIYTIYQPTAVILEYPTYSG